MSHEIKKEEQLLLEAVRGYLSSDTAKLGLAVHDDTEETSHQQWFQWENIDDMFALKASESPYHNNLTAAFYAVHSYKYLDDPTFKIAMDSELRSQGVPKEDRENASKFLDEIVEEMSTSTGWGEKDAGWNPAMDEIREITSDADTRSAPTSEPFTGGGPAPADDEWEQGYEQL